MSTLAAQAFAVAWEYNPLGMVAIDTAGKVCAVNPGFVRCTAISAAQVIGIDEADFNRALTGMVGLQLKRIEPTEESLRAIYFVNSCDAYDTGSLPIAETLREPLTSIYGFIELLYTQNYDEQTRQNLILILLEQVEVMSNLLNEQLDSHQILFKNTGYRLHE